jgi:hypothetical protein
MNGGTIRGTALSMDGAILRMGQNTTMVPPLPEINKREADNPSSLPSAKPIRYYKYLADGLYRRSEYGVSRTRTRARYVSLELNKTPNLSHPQSDK